MRKYIKPANTVVAIKTTTQLLTTSTLGIYDDGVDFGSMKSPHRRGIIDDEEDNF